MKTVRPDLTADEVEALLERSAVDLGAAGKRPGVRRRAHRRARGAASAAQAYVRPAPPVAPAPPPVVRRSIKFVWSCTAGATPVASGKRVYARVQLKSTLICKGRTVPALRNARVYVQRFAAKRGWKVIGTFRTNSRGRFGFTRKLTTLGGWTLRPSFPGATAVLPSSGAGVKVQAIKKK